MNFIKYISKLQFTLFAFTILFFACNMHGEDSWETIKPLPLDPQIESQIDEILPKLTLEQKVGQVIQGDSDSVTPEDVL